MDKKGITNRQTIKTKYGWNGRIFHSKTFKPNNIKKVITISYNEFVAYYENNPDLDNAEYYERFPETNKSTIRSWKSRLANIEPEIQEEEVKQSEGYEEIEKEYIKLLMTQTDSKESEFKGVDNKSKLLILKNRVAGQKENNKKIPANSTILGLPKPIGQNQKEYGLDDYITFDGNKNEIRMQIPMNVLLDPKKNRALGEIK